VFLTFQTFSLNLQSTGGKCLKRTTNMDLSTIHMIERIAHDHLAIWILAAARPLGFLLAFYPLFWTVGRIATLFVPVAFALAIPATGLAYATFNAQVVIMAPYTFLSAVLGELLIGSAIALAASMPFFIARLSGELVDLYRGEFGTGNPDEAGGDFGTFAHLSLAVMVLYATLNGDIENAFTSLLQSYSVLQVNALSDSQWLAQLRQVGVVMNHLMALAVFTAAPILIPMLCLDIIVMLISRFLRGYGDGQFAGALKNLCLLAIIGIGAGFWLHAATYSWGDRRALDLLLGG
jgi:type III secretory pathway component EscT